MGLCGKLGGGTCIWNFMVFFMIQMLLCVGSFFGTSKESEKEWEAYKTGSSTGGMFYCK